METELAQRLKVVVRMVDGTSIPEGCRLALSQDEAWHGVQRNLDSVASHAIDLPGMAPGVYHLSMILKGCEVAETIPPTHPDINRQRAIHIEEGRDAEFTVLLRRSGSSR